MTDIFVGVDVAKGDFVVACRPDGVRWTATNDAEGIAATVARLRSLGPRLIVLEATAGIRAGGGRRARSSGPSDCGREPAAGARLRQGHRAARHDRRLRGVGAPL